MCDDCHWEWCESCELYDILVLCSECEEENEDA